jgi:hypothetical protein
VAWQSVSEPTDGHRLAGHDRRISRTGPVTGVRQERTETLAVPGKRDPRNDAPVDDEQDVQGQGLEFDGLDDPGLAETQSSGRVRAIDDPRTNQQ